MFIYPDQRTDRNVNNSSDNLKLVGHQFFVEGKFSPSLFLKQLLNRSVRVFPV